MVKIEQCYIAVFKIVRFQINFFLSKLYNLKRNLTLNNYEFNGNGNWYGLEIKSLKMVEYQHAKFNGSEIFNLNSVNRKHL